ncbi:amidase family protein [Cupriavidus laharis]|uniref:amidase family protein n=1 Tax=Cupriavidus laharis TaxID=151654 RepID=UPI001CC7200F|nr:amidase family protein [Cupriavidus laharis]
MATRYHRCVLLAGERIVRGWRTAAAVKDLIDTAAIPATYGPAIYENFRPRMDAAAVTLAKTAGAVIRGKTVTTAEFAAFHPDPTRNLRSPQFAPRTLGKTAPGRSGAVEAHASARRDA